MKKTKWFVFLAITIVAALYVFVETPNLSPLYLDGALFWAVLITAYVGSATLLKIGEFTIQLNNFSYSAKAKFPKVPAIIIAVPWVIIAVVLVVCSVFFQWKAYRDQLGEPQDAVSFSNPRGNNESQHYEKVGKWFYKWFKKN